MTDSMEIQICNFCNISKNLDKFQKRKNGTYHKQCMQCGYEKAAAARNNRDDLRRERQKCIECNLTKNLLKFYEINDDYHTKCIDCCEGVEYVCGGCNTVKNFSEFYIRNDTNKPRGECKQCVLDRKRQWKSNNKERNKITNKQYRERPEIKEKNKQYQAELYKTPGHKEHKASLARINDKKRYATDVNYRLKKIMRARFKEVVNSGYKKESVLKMVGCSDDHLLKWLAYQFDDKMNWDNQGDYWHIDHIKPCALFNFTNVDEQHACFHWTNLQPMFKTDNIIKSDNYDENIKSKAFTTLQNFIYRYGNEFLTDEQIANYDTNFSNVYNDIDPSEPNDCNDILELYDDLDD